MKMKIFVSDDVRMANSDLWYEDNDAFNFFVFHIIFLNKLVANLHDGNSPFKVLGVMLLRITKVCLQ